MGPIYLSPTPEICGKQVPMAESKFQTLMQIYASVFITANAICEVCVFFPEEKLETVAELIVVYVLRD